MKLNLKQQLILYKFLLKYQKNILINKTIHLHLTNKYKEDCNNNNNNYKIVVILFKNTLASIKLVLKYSNFIKIIIIIITTIMLLANHKKILCLSEILSLEK